MLPCHACCVLCRLRCNGRSLLLGSYLSRVGRIENPSCSACGHSFQDTSHLIVHCPAVDSLRRSLFATLFLFTTSGPGPGELPGFWGSMVFRHAPIPSKGSCYNNNNIALHLLVFQQCRGIFQLLLSFRMLANGLLSTFSFCFAEVL